MQNRPSNDTSNKSPLYIFELFENILFYLSPCEIFLASSVCKYWHTCIANSPSLLRKTHKKPTPLFPNTNPHFIEPNLTCRNALIPRERSRYYGQNVLDLYESAILEFFSAMHPGISSEDGQKAYTNYSLKRHDYRAAFKDVRYPDGWPERYRTHCDLCDGFHARFKFENLHPLLSFLEDMTMCVQGHGGQLLVAFNIVNVIETTDTCYEHYHTEIRELAKKLKWAMGMMEKGDHQEEMFTRPVCTRLLGFTIKEYDIVSNAEGVTLREAIPFLIRAFKSHVSRAVKSMYEKQPLCQEGVSRDRRIVRDRRAAFPTKEDFRDFERKFGGAVERFDELMREVNDYMNGVAAEDQTMLWVERRGLGLLNEDEM